MILTLYRAILVVILIVFQLAFFLDGKYFSGLSAMVAALMITLSSDAIRNKLSIAPWLFYSLAFVLFWVIAYVEYIVRSTGNQG